MPAERRRRLFQENPVPPLSQEGFDDAVAKTARFARMPERRSGEFAERRRVRVAGPGEVDEAWDDLMRPAKRPA